MLPHFSILTECWSTRKVSTRNSGVIWIAVILQGSKNFASVITGSTLPVILSRYFQEPEVKHEICALLADFEENMPYRVLTV